VISASCFTHPIRIGRHTTTTDRNFYTTFFKETLPNLQRLDFRAAHFEQHRYVIPIPDSLFAKELPCLKELKYLGVTGGLTESAKHLTSCEIGFWEGSAGLTVISQQELQILFDNNKTIKSLTIRECEPFSASVPGVHTATLMKNLKSPKIYCLAGDDLETILECVHVPQFKSLDTVQLSLFHNTVKAVATDGFDHTFEFWQSIGNNPEFYPLRHLGADITTLRLDRGTTLWKFYGGPALNEFFQTLDAVQVLEFDGAIASAKNVLSNLSVTGVFPGLKFIRVRISRDDFKRFLQLLTPRVGSRGVGEALRS